MSKLERTKQCGFLKKASARGKLLAVATRKVVDRDGEVLLPRAFEKRLERFLANPIMLWQHDRAVPAIGNAEKIKIDDDEMTFEPVFAKSDFAQTVGQLYKDRILRAFSLNCIVHEFDEEKVLDEQTGITVTDAELLEISCVNIPANQEALLKAAQRYKAVGKHAELLLPPRFRDKATRTGVVTMSKRYSFDSIEEGQELLKKLERMKQLSGEYTVETDEDESGHVHQVMVSMNDGALVAGLSSVEDNHWHRVVEIDADGKGTLGKALSADDDMPLPEENQHTHTFQIPMEEEEPEGDEPAEEPVDVSAEAKTEDKALGREISELQKELVSLKERLNPVDVDKFIEDTVNEIITKEILGESI